MSIWDVANNALEKLDEFAEAQVETVYGALGKFLQGQVDKTTTKFDNTALRIVELGVRDKLIKKWPLDEYPLD
ncbi:unnamed protein product [marine sediment metagenome]|uniref:Uncharacterized protein n=1 Tax=marine sediment metagenome TaxID=412755 RepID=X1INM4_9ZZZZ